VAEFRRVAAERDKVVLAAEAPGEALTDERESA
jgi:hypothetical protein